MTTWLQKQIILDARSRGLHLVTSEVLDQLPDFSGVGIGLLHLFIQHTSAALALNENASPDVLHDMARDLGRIVPETSAYYRHTIEGPDDMPAHTKSVLVGPDLTIPIQDGRLALGTWQGIYLCEFRDRGGRRKLLATITGQQAAG